MIKWCGGIILAIGILVPAARPADVTLVPIDGFGRALGGCDLVEFQRVGKGSETGREYRSRFQSLTARDLPLGKYNLAISCNSSMLRKTILLTAPQQIELVVREERLMVSDPTKPELLIEMDRAKASGEMWWVIFTGLYNGLHYVVPFDAQKGRFALFDPETGSYFVTIESDGGYSCSQHIDFIEFSRSWRFDPEGCSFRLDDYAHIVTGLAKADDPWYSQMKLRIDEFFSALREATRKEKTKGK